MLVLLIILIQRVLKKILFIHTHIFITLVDQEYQLLQKVALIIHLREDSQVEEMHQLLLYKIGQMLLKIVVMNLEVVKNSVVQFVGHQLVVQDKQSLLRILVQDHNKQFIGVIVSQVVGDLDLVQNFYTNVLIIILIRQMVVMIRIMKDHQMEVTLLDLPIKHEYQVFVYSMVVELLHHIHLLFL